jgi:rhamnosyl/mannosyltransferase
MYCGSVPVTFTIEGSGVNWVSLKGETGEEVPLGDVKDYAAAIDKLLGDKELYMKYASAGKDRITRMFTCEQSVTEADKLFHQLINEE